MIPTKIMFLGDSIVAGYPTRGGFRAKIERALAGRGYRSVGPLADEDGRAHAGFVGHSLASILSMLPRLLSYAPDVLLVSAGGNGLPDTTPEEIGAQMRKIVDAFLRADTKLVYVSLIPDARNFTPLIRSYNRAIEKAVDKLPRVRVLDLGSQVGPADKDSPYYADDVHPSRLGYEKMADMFLARAFHMKAKKEPLASVHGTGSDLVGEARRAIDAAYPALHPAIRRWALAVGLLSRYGTQEPWTYASEPSYNWGMVPYNPNINSGCFRAMSGETLYAKYAGLEEGAIGLVETWADAAVRRAAISGSAEEMAAAMGRDALYAEALKSALDAVDAVVETPIDDPFRPVSALVRPTSALVRPASALVRPASAATGEQAEASPVSAANLGVLAITLGIFLGTLAIAPRKS